MVGNQSRPCGSAGINAKWCPMEWLEGKKSYLIAFVVAVVGLLQAFGVVLPEWLIYILAAAGVTTIRSAIAKAEPPK